MAIFRLRASITSNTVMLAHRGPRFLFLCYIPFMIGVLEGTTLQIVQVEEGPKSFRPGDAKILFPSLFVSSFVRMTTFGSMGNLS